MQEAVARLSKELSSSNLSLTHVVNDNAELKKRALEAREASQQTKLELVGSHQICSSNMFIHITEIRGALCHGRRDWFGFLWWVLVVFCSFPIFFQDALHVVVADYQLGQTGLDVVGMTMERIVTMLASEHAKTTMQTTMPHLEPTLRNRSGYVHPPLVPSPV